MSPWVRIAMIELSDGRRVEIVDGHVSKFGDCDKDFFAPAVEDALAQLQKTLDTTPEKT